jgi:hypothetical protein
MMDGEYYYFGKDKAIEYGARISKALHGRAVSKRHVQKPGGLEYEAAKLNIEPWDFFEALEAMCHEGRADEIDEATYLVI